MKCTHILTASLLLLSACNFTNEPAPPDDQNSTTEKTTITAAQEIAAAQEEIIADAGDSVESFVDSFRIKCNEALKARVELPPIYQHEIFEANDEATQKFSGLSKACKGRMKVIVNSATVVNELSSTIRSVSVSESDLVILIDRSGSMAPHIEKVKEGVNQIIDSLKRYKGTRLAVATYGDKNYDGNWWFSFKNFETDYNAAAEYVKQIKAISNMDWPESVYDAVMKCMENDFWRSTKKCNLILVGDAPPQEKPLSDYTLDDVIKRSKEMKVRMNFYPILIMPQVKEVILSEEDKAKYHQVTNNTKLYPNPCTGTLNLGMQNSGTYYLEMYNTNGQVVMNEEFFGLSWNKDISNLPNGVYILRVINSDHSFELFKFILQH